MRCENCGAPRGRSDAFCPRCGWHFDDGAQRQVVIPPRRALVPYRLDRAVLIGGATTAGLSAVWWALRWLLPRLLDALRRRASAQPAALATAVVPERGMQVEVLVWVRRVIIHRR